MSNEALENELYQRMAAEQKAFAAELLKLTPEEILQKAREYVMRENILQVLGDYPGTEAQTQTLLKSDTPLASIYAELEKQGSDNGINEIKECVESLTNAIAAAEAEQREALRNLPVYPYPADYARQNGELEQYRASYKANVACKEAIEAAINGNYACTVIRVCCTFWRIPSNKRIGTGAFPPTTNAGRQRSTSLRTRTASAPTEISISSWTKRILVWWICLRPGQGGNTCCPCR